MDEREALIDRLVEFWQTCRGGSDELSVSELCENYPEIEQEVRSRIDAILALEPLLNVDHEAFISQHELPSHVGPYEVVDLVARSNGSVVYAALQLPTNRKVAVKFVHAAMLNEESLARFKVEAQALGRLAHPDIASVYDAGLADVSGTQLPYIAMEFVRGVTLDEYLATEERTLESKTRLLTRIAQAIAHAHERGVIHRDLKPSNIMVTADGEPKIIDFGIARLEQSDLGTITHTGHRVLGTIPYMSPEQLAGNTNAIGPASDVFSIGVLAYRVITGELPFETSRATVPEAIRLVTSQPPTPLDVAVPKSRGDLATIVHKALERRPQDRYPSVAELAEDLRSHCHGQPITTSGTQRVRLKDWLQGPIGMIAICACFVAIYFAGKRANDNSAPSYNRQPPVNYQLRKEGSQRPSIDWEKLQAAHELSNSQHDQALELLYDETTFPPESRAFAWGLVDTHLKRTRQTIESDQTIQSTASSPFDNHLAIIRDSGDVHVWHPADRNGQGQYLRARFDMPTKGSRVSSFAFSTFEKYFAIGLSNGDVVVLDGRRANLVARIARRESVPVSLAFQDDHDLVVIDNSGDIEVYDSDDFATPRTFESHQDGELRASSITPHGSVAAVAYSDGHLEIRNLTVGKVFQFELKDEPSSLAFKKGHLLYAVVGQQIFEANTLNNTLKEVHSVEQPILAASPLAINKFAVATSDAVKVFSANPKTLRSDDLARRVSFSFDRKKLFLQTTPNRVIVHQLSDTCGRIYSGISSTVVAEIPSQERLVFGGLSGELLVVDRSTGKPLTKQVVLDGPIKGIAVNELRGEFAVTNGSRLELWDHDLSSRVASCDLNGDDVFSLGFREDGLLYVTTSDGRVGTWGADRNSPLSWADYETHGPIQICPVSNLMAISYGTSCISIRSPSQAFYAMGAYGDSNVRALAISAGGEAAACDVEGMIFVDSLLSTRSRVVCQEEGEMAECMALSPDGNTLATADQNSGLHIWDALTGKKQLVIRNDRGPLQALLFTRDGKSLVAATATGRWIIWDSN